MNIKFASWTELAVSTPAVLARMCVHFDTQRPSPLRGVRLCIWDSVCVCVFIHVLLLWTLSWSVRSDYYTWKHPDVFFNGQCMLQPKGRSQRSRMRGGRAPGRVCRSDRERAAGWPLGPSGTCQAVDKVSPKKRSSVSWSKYPQCCSFKRSLSGKQKGLLQSGRWKDTLAKDTDNVLLPF